MATFDRKVECDVKKLIKCLTEFEDDSENFQASVDFALSNFRFHRFLDVNSHKIERTLKGVSEKFSIHSQPQKQEIFTKLSNEFLNSSLFVGQAYTKTDTHYGMLSLLLNLSNSPVNQSFEEKPKPVAIEKKDEFDWGKYLLEGIDIPRYDSASDEEWSDDEVTEAGKDNEIVKVETKEVKSDENKATIVHSVPDALHSGKEWLARNVVVQYWKGQQEKNIWSPYPASNVCREWEKYCYETHPFYQPGTKTTLTEAQVVRETIWVLCGARQSFVYCHTDNTISCNPDIQVSHLTPNTLYNLLNYFARYAKKLHALYGYIQNAICHHHHHGDDRMCQTLQAFLSSLSWFLQKEFQTRLCVIEKEVMKQEKGVTLTELQKRISCQLEQISMLYEIYDVAIVRSNANAAVLLTAIFDKILLMQDNTGEVVDRSKVCLLLAIFLQTSKPYLTIIDGWIGNGTLTDPANEFIISRNQAVKTTSSNFWEKGYTIQIVESNHQGETVSKEKPASHLQPDQELPQTKVGIPGFLEPILYKVVLGGKSRDLLESLQRLTDKKLDIYQDGRIPLFDSFMTSLNSLWGLKTSVSMETKDCTDEDDADLTKDLVLKTTNNQLLQRNAQIQTKYQSPKHKSCVLDELYGSLLSAFQHRPLDIHLAMDRCLYPHIDVKCVSTSKLLVDVLKSEYQLLDYLAAVRWFYLMEAGDAMYDFYVDVFEKLRLQEHWQSTTYLNLALQDALQTHHTDHVDRLKVSVETAPKTSRLPINALDGLTLHYKVPWPVDVVFNCKAQRIYNDIFRLLLQVKRAKYCLDQLRFTDLTGYTPTVHNVQHRVHLLRVRLLHFVNLLHNYIMTRILHSTGLEFQQQLTTASDLNQVLDIHKKYMKNIYERCLLNEKMGYVREAIIKVLNLTLNFQKRWDAGINTISEQSLDNMEEEFKKCNSFLAKLFSNAVKRGAFPHMELLAQSLQNTVDT